MNLLGWPLVFLVGGSTLLAIVALVVFWPRLAGNRPRNILVRGLSIVGMNVLVLFLVGLLLNRAFLFYASWTDLANSLGKTQAQTRVQRGGSATGASSTRLKPGEGRSITVHPPKRLPKLSPSRRLTFTVHGHASGITSRVVVQLPPGYTQASAAQYPVLETFQGYPGQPTQWLRVLKLGDAVDSEAAVHLLRAPIIVSPQTEVPAGVDTECVNGDGSNPKVETWLTTDVPNFVVTHFHVRTDRQAWATIGLSAGGWCAAMAALRHPGTYSAAIVMGGYFKPSFGSHYRPFPADSPQARRYDLVTLARKTPPPVAIWLETSHADRDSWPTSRQFLAAVHRPTSVTATVLQNAGHRMSVWEGLLPEALHWLGTSVAGFRP